MGGSEVYRGSVSQSRPKHDISKIIVEGVVGTALVGVSVGAFYQREQISVDEAGAKLSKYHEEILRMPAPEQYRPTPIINYNIIQENPDVKEIRRLYEETKAEYDQAARELDGIRRGIEENPSYKEYVHDIRARNRLKGIGVFFTFASTTALGTFFIRELRRRLA